MELVYPQFNENKRIKEGYQKEDGYHKQDEIIYPSSTPLRMSQPNSAQGHSQNRSFDSDENNNDKSVNCQDQNNQSYLLSQSNITQNCNKSNDQINKGRYFNNSDHSDGGKESYSSDEESNPKIRAHSSSIQSSNLQSRRDQDQRNPSFQRKSTSSSKTIKQESLIIQKSGDYNMEFAGVIKRRMLFEVGYASDERKQMQKQGLDEEQENEFTFTFEDDNKTEQTRKKKRSVLSKKFNTNDNILDSSNRMLESDRYYDDTVVESNRSIRGSTNNRRFSDACSQKIRSQYRQNTYSDTSNQSKKLLKLYTGDDQDPFTPSRSTHRSNTYNRNNVFEEDNVEVYSQRRKSKFLINQKSKLNFLTQQQQGGGGEQLSPTKSVDRNAYYNQNLKSLGNEEQKSSHNLQVEPNTPLPSVSPIFYISEKGLTGADLQWRFVGIMKRVKKFTKCLLDHIYYQNFNNVSKLHINAIGDIVYFELSDFDVNLKNLKKKLRVIEPSDTIAFIWNFLLMFSIAISIFLIPLKTSFDLSFDDNSFQNIVLEKFPKSILIGDIFVNFFLAYYEKGVLIVEINKIWSNYLKYKFFFNTVTTLSFVIEIDNNQLIQWICMLRIFQLPKLIGMIDEHFQLQQRFNTYFELIKLILLIVSMAHFVGCGFHFSAQYDISKGNQLTWLNFFQFAEENVELRYLNSIYFAFITMITVGYGDITPISPREKIYVIVITVISCGLFGYSMNTIGNLFFYLLILIPIYHKLQKQQQFL